MPVGAHILCPEKARKSQPNSCTSSGRCPALCAASTRVSAPTARACRQRSATGLIVPSELEICVKANSFTSGVSNCGKLIERERAILTHRHETQARAGSLRQELPRHEIAVVFHLGEKNHIIRRGEIFRPTPARQG